MKQIIFVRLVVLAVASLFSTGAFAQLSAQSSFSGAVSSADKMALAGMKAVSEKMHSHFAKNFKNATDIRVRPEADHTQISFKENGTSASVQYNKKGKFQYSVRTYDADKLPEGIRDEVERNFPGYTVFGFVNDIDVLDKSAKLVMIENRNSWKRVRILDGQISVYEEYNKAK